MKKYNVTKIPYVLKNVSLPKELSVSSTIPSEEGTVILVKAKSHLGKKNDLDFTSSRLGWLWEGDIIPGVLGYRKAATEFAGIVPEKVKVGDTLHLLCESGVVGKIEGVFPAWGTPMEVEVLGAVAGINGTILNIKNYVLFEKTKENKKEIPLIIFLSTIMDAGKTTMITKLIHQFVQNGKSVATIKLTGVAFSQDLMKMKDAGATTVYDFVDNGLPSTCNGNSKQVVTSALSLVSAAKEKNPDIIFAEFGDGVLGEYHV
ncbi:MAG: molybdopterin-guanine dinucleotide biosynthesis protein MobB, partial [Candidatus Levyibacteriota bacterium]